MFESYFFIFLFWCSSFSFVSDVVDGNKFSLVVFFCSFRRCCILFFGLFGSLGRVEGGIWLELSSCFFFWIVLI